jgi:hypothetical protein
MKKILTLLICFALSLLTGYGQPPETLKYNLIQNGAIIEVWGTPDDNGTPTTATLPAGSQVVLRSQLGSGSSINVITDVNGSWSNNTTDNNGSLDYTIIVGGNPVATIDPFETGIPVHLFDFEIPDCFDGDVSIMDSSDPNPPGGGLNWTQYFFVIMGTGGVGDIYIGNEPGHEISCLGLLPVEFLSFTGSNIEAGNQLNWQTASEINNSGFEVQKSANGVNWELIDWVEGKGRTTDITSYELLDRLPFSGDNYYRLKQIDYDGKYEFSEVINIKRVAGDVSIQVQPNPSDGDFTVTVENPNKEKMKIILFDSVGQTVWSSELIRDLDFWKKEFTLSQKEMYFLNIQIGDKNYTEKILIIDRK